MQPPERPRLALADKSPLVLSALREMFERDNRFHVVQACTAGATLLSALTRGAFDLIVTGWRLSDMTAADLLSQLSACNFNYKVMVVSSDADANVLRRCVKLGAMGFCWQNDDPSVLLETADAVNRNRISLPYLNVSRIDETPLSRLTARERDLLKALSDGWTNLQIASRFGISENTVKYHLRNVYEKLGVKNRAMAVTLFITESVTNS
jgi:DNA-binding NarL/FixJ family response regulator